MNSIRFAVRSLLKSPAHTVVALITLALGIGVNTSMFSVVNALLFRTAPYPDAESLVVLMGQNRGGEMRAFSEQEVREIRASVEGFSSLLVAGYARESMAQPGRPAERLTGVTFSREMFAALQMQPAIGRPFSDEEFEPGKNNVILLSDTFWRSRFGGDRNVIGKTVRLDAHTVTIIGVMPPAFEYPLFWGPVTYWRPLNFTREQIEVRAYRAFSILGRLKPGVTADQIGIQLASLARKQESDYPQEYAGLKYTAVPMHVATMDRVGRAISWMLLGLSGFVLLIACANLANLQLARATASIRESAIRAALGATRGRLMFHQLTECVVLSISGGLLGLLVAMWINGVLERSILIGGMPLFKAPIDLQVFGISMGVSLFTGIVFGIVPAFFVSRADVNTALKSQSRGATAGRGHHRMRQFLIIGEVALALILLGGAAVMNRGFNQLLTRQVGWDTSKVVTGILPIPEARYDTPEKRIEFFRRLEARLQALPGVESAALATSLPLFNYTGERKVFVDAPSQGTVQDPLAAHVMITSDYFATMGIRILEGQTFARDVKADGPQQIIVNEALAQKFWPGQSAVGKRLGVSDESAGRNAIAWREVIAVVSDVDPAANIVNPMTRLAVYRPLVQEPWSFINLVVRSQNPASISESVRKAVFEVDPDLPADNLGTIRQFVDRTQHNLVVISRLLLGFATLGLILAAVGIYGVISNLVAQRTNEFGIRLALGAKPSDVLSDVLRKGAVLTVVGLIFGFVGAFALGRFLSSVMPRLASNDPVFLLLISAVLLAVAIAACWFPARRATRVDPMTALRAE